MNQKPRKWKPRLDAGKCLACEKPFRRGDRVYEDVGVTLHEACLALYWEQLQEAGLLKRPQRAREEA